MQISSVKTTLTQAALNHLERKYKQMLILEAIAEAACEIAKNPEIVSIPGGKELIEAVKSLE